METKRQPATFSFEAPPHVLIVEARADAAIADLQLQGAKAVLDSVKASYEIVTVPGVLEIPAAIGFALKALDFDPLRRRADGYLALGCVIKDDTMQGKITAKESAHSLQRLTLDHYLAIGNGILVGNNREQAVEQADPAQRDQGGVAAEACLRMIELKHHFRLSPKRRWVAK